MRVTKKDYINFAKVHGLKHHLIEYKSTQWIINDLECALDNLIGYAILSNDSVREKGYKAIKVSLDLLKLGNYCMLESLK
jgi:hypothetical protein